MKRLMLDYLNLYLFLWPVPNNKYLETWNALEALYKQGKVRAIGVSNFNINHLENIIGQCDIIPAVNQIELHPWLLQTELIRFMGKHKIFPESLSG